MKVLAISGSLRKDSWNRKLLQLAVGVVEKLGAEVREFDLTPVPIYNGDVERVGTPEPAHALRQAIQEADAVVIASPEYNGSMSAAIKNALEWASRPPLNVLKDKVFFVMGCGPGRGGAKSMYSHLSYSIEAEGGWVVPSPRVLLPRVDAVFSSDGEMLDESVGDLLDQAMRSLLLAVRRLGTDQRHAD